MVNPGDSFTSAQARRTRWRSLVALAETQCGLASVEQAWQLGYSDKAIAHLVRSGRCERHLPEVLRLAGAHRTWQQDAHGALLTCGPGSVISHRSAAAVWGFEGFSPGVVEVVVPRWTRRRGRSSHLRVHESTDLALTDIARRSGLRVTTPERTLIDLGAVVGFLRVEQAFDDAVRSGIVTHGSVLARWREIARRGRRGCGVVRRILEERDPGSATPDSTFEARVLRLVREHGLPEPVLQHEVRGPGWRARIDLAWPQHRVGVECDGLAHHFGRQRLQWDDGRQNRLVLAGWTILRFTWHDVADNPDQVAEQIDAALSRTVAV